MRAPAQGSCPYANICEHCPNFRTDPSFLAVLGAQRVDAQALAADAETRGWAGEAARHLRLVQRLDELNRPRHQRAGVTDTQTQRVRAACERLLAAGHDVTFTAVAQASGIARATCYRNRELRAIIDTYRSRHGEQLTLTALADRLGNLSRAFDALAGKARHQEEEIRSLKRATQPASSPRRSHDRRI